MAPDELRAFLDEQMTMQCATNGPRGLPHMVPLWFYRDGDDLCGWTFAKSQKARNLERDPRATLGVEDGVSYDQLRGVMFETEADLSRDVDVVTEHGTALFARYAPGGGDAVQNMIAQQAPKRVALRFRPTRTVTWDHRKLGGVY